MNCDTVCLSVCVSFFARFNLPRRAQDKQSKRNSQQEGWRFFHTRSAPWSYALDLDPLIEPLSQALNFMRTGAYTDGVAPFNRSGTMSISVPARLLPSSAWGLELNSAGKKTAVPPSLLVKTIILPGQARDKHREILRKAVFLQLHHLNHRPVTTWRWSAVSVQ